MKAFSFAGFALFSTLAFAAVEYQVVEGTEDVLGMPDKEKLKALQNWQSACDGWKRQVREMNKDNQVLAAGCARPRVEKEDNFWVYRSTGLYKVKTRIREDEAPKAEK